MRSVLLLLAWLIAPTLAAAQQPTGPILRTELEKEVTISSQPIVLRVTVLVSTWLPQPPVFPSFEVPNVIVRLPARASGPVTERVGGDTWSGVTRAYRLYPMIAGRFRIPPQPVTVTYAEAETRKPVTVELRTDAVVFAGTVPAGAKDLDPFIAATALKLEQTIEGEPQNLVPSGAFTRIVTAEVKGTSPIFLPPLIPPLTAEGLAVYPKQPVITESEEGGSLSGSRVESVTTVGEAGGRSSAPPIRLRWYNLATEAVETAEVPGFDIAIRGPAALPSSALDWRAVVPWIAIVVVALAPVGVVVWRLWPRLAAWGARRHEAHLQSERYAFKDARAALRARDFGKAVRAVHAWSSRLPPASGAQESRLVGALTNLGAELYGTNRRAPSARQWSDALAALSDARHCRLAALAAARGARGLPPLNPQWIS